MSHSFPLRLALVSSVALAIAGPVAAQSVSMTFSNTDLPPIPLLDSSSVSIDANGNLSAQCVLNGSKCQGITGGSGNAPVITLVRNNGEGDITSGGAIGLTWTVQNGAEICLATSTPAVSGWNNSLVAVGGASQSLTLSASGEYTFGLKCYTDGGASNSASVAATVTGTTGPDLTIPQCTAEGIAGDALVQPAGFTGHRKTWSQLFYGAEFPEGRSFLSPIGSYTLRDLAPATRGPTMNARYITTSFVAGNNANYAIDWLGAQAIVFQGEINYNPPRGADSVFVSISPCAGDLRPRVNVNPPTHWVSGVCRGMVRNGGLSFGTTGGSGQCALQAGQEYFITIAFVNPTDGLTTTEHTCQDGNAGRCEGNFDGL
jgi:hypothetical protein